MIVKLTQSEELQGADEITVHVVDGCVLRKFADGRIKANNAIAMQVVTLKASPSGIRRRGRKGA